MVVTPPLEKRLNNGRRSHPAGSTTAHAAWVTEVLRAFDQFRFLCAVREGDWGVAGVNRAVEVALEQAGSFADPSGTPDAL